MRSAPGSHRTARLSGLRRSRRGVRFVAVPTTLSAGEFTSFAGCTDTVRHVKESFGTALMMPSAVILDPAVTLHTPEWLFLSTGIRAVDHAVEDICSINPTPFSDGASLHALRLLSRGLPAVKRESRRSGGEAGLPVGGVDVDHGLAERRDQGREPRHRACTGWHRGCAARLHVVRHAAACAAVQSSRSTRRVRHGWPRPWARPTMPAADAVAALIACLGLPATLARCRGEAGATGRHRPSVDA